MKNTNQCEVYFKLVGDDFDPEEVTQALGVNPTTAKRKGEPRPKYSHWSLSSGEVIDDYIDVYDMASEVVSKLSHLKDEINDIKSKLDLEAELQVVLWITTDDSVSTPAIGFDIDVIDFLSSVGANIDIDTYRN